MPVLCVHLPLSSLHRRAVFGTIFLLCAVWALQASLQFLQPAPPMALEILSAIVKLLLALMVTVYAASYAAQMRDLHSGVVRKLSPQLKTAAGIKASQVAQSAQHPPVEHELLHIRVAGGGQDGEGGGGGNVVGDPRNTLRRLSSDLNLESRATTTHGGGSAFHSSMADDAAAIAVAKEHGLRTAAMAWRASSDQPLQPAAHALCPHCSAALSQYSPAPLHAAAAAASLQPPSSLPGGGTATPTGSYTRSSASASLYQRATQGSGAPVTSSPSASPA